MVLSGRDDIIGDLARLRGEFTGAANQTEDLLSRLEVLAAAAVRLGMSHNIVGKASGIPRERIDAVLDTWPHRVEQWAEAYERSSGGVVHLRDDSADDDPAT